MGPQENHVVWVVDLTQPLLLLLLLVVVDPVCVVLVLEVANISDCHAGISQDISDF